MNRRPIEITNEVRKNRAERYIAQAKTCKSKGRRKFWAQRALAELNAITELGFAVETANQARKLAVS